MHTPILKHVGVLQLVWLKVFWHFQTNYLKLDIQFLHNEESFDPF